MEKDNRKYAIYSRKSKFTGKGESIENQVELCRQHIKIQEPSLTDDKFLIFEDEGFSGGNTNRPQFQAMMKKIRNNEIKAVVCYKLDRISRNVGDFAQLKDEFDYYNVDFISLRDNFDTTSPSGRAMMMMVSVFAQLERENTAERIRDNMHELAKSGRWLGGTTPTGYKSVQIVGSVTVDGKERKAYKLETVDKEAEIVKLVFEQFLKTNSLTKTDTYLLQNNITTKNGKAYSRFSIKTILKNPVYAIADQDTLEYFSDVGAELYADESEFDGQHGMMAYNKTLQRSGRTNKTRDFDEWIVAVGKHKGLISGEKWVKVQKMLEQNASKAYRKPKSNVALLSGLLFCGSCGGFMRPKLSSRENLHGEKIYSYLCETKERSHGMCCHSKNPNGNVLDEAVCEQIKLVFEDNSQFMKGLRNIRKEIEGNQESYRYRMDKLKKELRECEINIEKLVDALVKAADTPAFEYVSNQITQQHEKKKSLQEQIANLDSIENNKNFSLESVEGIYDYILSFRSNFDSMTVEQKRMALRIVVRKIVWDGENVHLFLFGDPESDIDYTLLMKKGDSCDESDCDGSVVKKTPVRKI